MDAYSSAYNDTTLEEMRIPNEIVGMVIGRGGAKIRQLQDDSDCRIVLAMSSNGEQTRAVALQGTAHQIQVAKDLINELAVSGFAFLVPQEKVGLLFGKKGETIKKIQNLTGTEISVGSRDLAGHPGQRQVRISGAQVAVEEASKNILEILNNEFVCGICMEVVLEKEGEDAKFGILPSCTHCFCLPCISKWRKAKFDEEITKSCPECRVVQDFVIPSNYWVENPTSKAEFVEKFKKNAGKKDCQAFMQNLGHCPSGSKCVYSHQNYASGQQVETVKIPENCVGLVIGKGGVNIKNLQAQTNTRMMVMQQSIDQEGTKDLRIAGASADVEDAVIRVQMLVLDCKMRKLRTAMSNFSLF